MIAPTFFESAAEFRKWLEQNAESSRELVVGFHKVATGRSSMTWSESVDEALCFGWIDGVRKRIDDESYLIRFTPRKPNSNWSAVNIKKYRELDSQGRMTAAGARAFADRKAEKSRKYSYEQAEAGELTDAEHRQFKRDPEAWRYWEGCPPGYRKKAIHWIVSAKKTSTRASRLAKLIELSAAGKRW